MSLGLNFNFGRLLRKGERVTTAKINAIIKGMSAALTGTVDTGDITAGAVTPAKTSPGAYWYASASFSAGTYTASFTPAVTSYTDGMVLAFKAGGTNTGAASLDAGVGGKPLRREGGAALEAEEIPTGMILEVRYNSTLVAGGCWEITSLLKLLPARMPMANDFTDLTVCSSAASPNTQLIISQTNYGEVISQDINGITRRHVNIGGSVDITVSGAGGRDTGNEANSTWYYMWFIYNPTTNTENFVLSTNNNFPTMPSGYTFAALISVVYNDSGGNLVQMMQQDRCIYVAEQTVFTGQAGTTSLTFSNLDAFVPPIAKQIRGNMGSSTSAVVSMAVAGGAGMPAGVTTPAAIGSGTIGVSRVQCGNSAVTLGGFFNAGAYEVPPAFSGVNIGVYTVMPDTTAKYAMTITGYDI